jgi:hypothetical protein
MVLATNPPTQCDTKFHTNRMKNGSWYGEGGPLMKVDIKKSGLENVGADALVVFVAKRLSSKNADKKKLAKKALPVSKTAASVEGISKAIQSKIQSALDDSTIAGATNETVLFRTKLCARQQPPLLTHLRAQKFARLRSRSTRFRTIP